MPPLLALGLLAVAGLLATRLPWVALPQPPRRQIAVGLAALASGAALGPGIGVLDRATLDHLEPVAVLATVWLGASVGLTVDRRLVRRVPGLAWQTGATVAVATTGVVGVALAVLMRFVPVLSTLWVPRLEAIGVLACVATLSEAGRPERRLPHTHTAGFAALETGAGTLLLACLALALPPHPAPAGRVRDLILFVAACAAVALFGPLRRLPRLAPVFALALALLFGGSLAAAAGFSPFVSGAIGAAVWTRVAGGGALRAALGRWERAMTTFVAVLAGAQLGGPLWLIVAAVGLVVVREATRWGTLASLGRAGRCPWPPETALATIAQGPTALAAGLGFTLTARGAGPSVLSTLVLAVALGQGAALCLPPAASPLTRSPVAPELSADS